jgi:hypothetical protein
MREGVSMRRFDASVVRARRGTVKAICFAWCLWAAEFAVEAVGFVAGPYLSNPKMDGITVCWVTDTPRIGEVEFGETEQYGTRVETAVCDQVIGTKTPTHVCKARLRGLAPGKTYFYRVSGNGLPDERRGRFRIPPREEPFVAAFQGDWLLLDDRDIGFVEKRAGRPIDLVVDVGDTGQHRRMFSFAAKWHANIPCILVKGNHCNEGIDKKEIQHYFDYDDDRTDRAFDYGPARWVIGPCVGYTYAFSPEQLAWIDESLAKTDRPWKFFVNHHVFFSDATHGVSTFAHKGKKEGEEGERRRQQLWPILMKHNVRIAFHGHDHCYQRTFPIDKDGKPMAGGTIGLDVAAGSYKRIRESAWMARFVRDSGPVYMKLDGERGLCEFHARPPKRKTEYTKADAFTFSVTAAGEDALAGYAPQDAQQKAVGPAPRAEEKTQPPVNP